MLRNGSRLHLLAHSRDLRGHFREHLFEPSTPATISRGWDKPGYSPPDLGHVMAGPTVDCELSGDFNHLHPTWGGNHIQPRFIEDPSELIVFFHAHGLHGCLS